MSRAARWRAGVDTRARFIYQNPMKIFLRLFPFGLALCVWSPVWCADAPATFKVSEFVFTRPADWEWVESVSQMRKAELKVVEPGTKAKAEVVFYHFGPGDAGGTQANVDRWFGQFAEARDKINAKKEDVTVGKHKVTYVSAEGTYKSGMPGGPQTPMANYALLGAIIEADGGSVFVKMTGPKQLTQSRSSDFRKMVESALKR